MTQLNDSAAPEMPRPFLLSRLGNGATVTVEATGPEMAALARRMRVAAIHRLSCRFDLASEAGKTVRARGILRATVRQVCVVSLREFEQVIAEDFAVRFVPAGTESEAIDLDADDEIGYANDMLDLGEAASEQLALALDPFPREPGVELPSSHENTGQGAFAALARLRRPS